MTETGTGDASRLLTPYVPRLVIDWLRDQPETPYRAVDGTGVFADISGFTNLTEKLAHRGKAGAEEMGDVLNAMFEELLGAAYQYGAGLIKWGGDAVLLLFEGARHAEMACRAAFEMQRVIRRIGRLETSSGVVRLRMSIGVHTGPLDFLLVGRRFRELIITGPGATTIAQMEKGADAGEIVVSPGTVAAMSGGDPDLIGAAKGGGYLLVGAPDVPRSPAFTPSLWSPDLPNLACDPLLHHLLGGTVDAEHRHVAVSFVEFQGADELLARLGPAALTEAVTAFVNACQEAAAANDITFLSSDIIEDGAKVILMGGAPTNVGDSEARVLTATRAVIDAGGPLPIKAGVNCGRVFAGDYGTSYRRVYSITGDIVNLAARLMAKADLGQIVATPAVLDRSRTKFRCEQLEPFPVKGKTALIEASVVGPMIEGGLGVGNQLPLIGREAELAVLVAALEQAQAGQGQVVELMGPAGIGKSRLLQEIIDVSSVATLWANGDIYQRTTPYLPLQRLFKQQLGLEPDAENSQVALALSDLVNSVAPELSPWLPLVGSVVGVEMPMTEEVRVMDAEGRKERLEWATSTVLGRLLTTPTLFVFNDLYFMDEATIDLVRRLASDVVDRPWLIVTTRRPDTNGDLEVLPHIHVIDLEPLSGEATDRLLEAATALAPMPEHRLHALGLRAGGNPLFLIELAAASREFTDAEQIPDSIEGVISARIDLLEPQHRRVLRSASVLGMTVDLETLQSIMAVETKSSLPPFDRWNSLSEFMVPIGGGQLEWAHHLVRDTAYEGLSYRRRVVLHGRTADVLETRLGPRANEQAALLSEHCFNGERFHAAWHYARHAANGARKVYANADAATLYRRALSSADRLPNVNREELITTCESLSSAYDDLGEFDSAQSVLGRARRHVGPDPLRMAQIELKTAIIRQRMGKFPLALSGLSRGLAGIADISGDDAACMRASLLTRYAWIRFFQGRTRDMIRWAERGITEATSCDDKPDLAHCFEVLEWAGIELGQIPDESPARKALAIYEELGDVAGQASIHNTLGAREYYRGNWSRAAEHYHAAEDAYRRSGSIWGTVVPMASRAEILSDQGYLDQAAPIATEALRLGRGSGVETDMAFVRGLLGRIAARRGHHDQALALYAEAREYYASAGVTSSVVQMAGLVAECQVFMGQPDAAIVTIDAARQGARGLEGVDAVEPLLHRVRAVALATAGQRDEGALQLRQCIARARDRAMLPELAWALISLLEVTHDAPPDDEAALRAELAAAANQLGLARTDP